MALTTALDVKIGTLPSTAPPKSSWIRTGALQEKRGFNSELVWTTASWESTTFPSW